MLKTSSAKKEAGGNSSFHFGDDFPYSWEEAKRELKDNLVYCFSDFFSTAQANFMVDAFYNAKTDWTEGFKGQQYALGEVWYHYAETKDDMETYRDNAVASRAIVEKHIPGLHDYILRFLSHILGTQNVAIREGWAGPGIVSFLANNYVANKGGGLHYDIEGLDERDYKDDDFHVYSFVAMLQKPESGAGLRIWDKRFDYHDPKDAENVPEIADMGERKSARIDYEVGDLWVFGGLNAHHIEKFTGDKDRICLTFHIAQRKGRWEVWF